MTIPDSVTTMDAAFFACPYLTHVKLPSGLTRIDDYMFCGCLSLADVVIPGGVTFIGDLSFYSTNIARIEIPAGTTEIGISPFGRCMSLVEITVASGNAAFEIKDDGVLFSKAGDLLIAYPAGNPAKRDDHRFRTV